MSMLALGSALILSHASPEIARAEGARATLPSSVEISRIATTFFPNQESCLQTQLMDVETAQWIQQETKKVADLKVLFSPDSNYSKELLKLVKEGARFLAGKQIPDYSKKNSINRASLIVYPEHQYLLTYNPQDLDEIRWFWKNALEFNTQKIVAALMPNEDEVDHNLEYCLKSNYPLKISEDWTIDLVAETVLAVSKQIQECYIVKRTFCAYSKEQETTFEHYHYQGWKNKKGAPDAELLATLILQLGSYSPRLVHCACGRGRSGNVVLADIFRERLLSQLGEKSLEDATLNIAEILFQGRLLRDGFVESPEQITSAFQAAIESLKS